MNCAIIGDSRCRGLRASILGEYSNLIGVRCVPSATIEIATDTTIEYLSNHPYVNCIYLNAGICNITLRDSMKRVVMRPASYNVVKTVETMKVRYEACIRRIKNFHENTQVIICAVYGSELNRTWTGFGTHRDQDLLNALVKEVNIMIVSLNTLNCVITPRPDHYVHVYDKSTRSYQPHFDVLYDGTHPDDETKRKIGKNLGGCMRKNEVRPINQTGVEHWPSQQGTYANPYMSE